MPTRSAAAPWCCGRKAAAGSSWLRPIPRAPPRIRQNFLATERGLGGAAGRVCGWCARSGEQAPLAEFVAAEIAPGPERRSDAEIDAHVRATGITVHHPLGTCKMGRERDEAAVVDPELRVRGVDGLRVVDASVMPDLVGGNINAPVIMIAEKAADLIRGRAAARAGERLITPARQRFGKELCLQQCRMLHERGTLMPPRDPRAHAGPPGLTELAAAKFVETHGGDALRILEERAETAVELGHKVAARTWRGMAEAAARMLGIERFGQSPPRPIGPFLTRRTPWPR